MSEGGRHSLISSLLRGCGYLDKAVVWKASDASPHKANRQTFNLNTLPPLRVIGKRSTFLYESFEIFGSDMTLAGALLHL